MRPHPRPGPRSGWSRSETLLITGLVLLVVSLVVPGWFIWRQRQRLAMARADIETLVAAVARYHREYGVWPTARVAVASDLRYGLDRPNAAVLSVLRAIDAPGNEGHRVNDQRVLFIEVEPYGPGGSGLDSRGSFLDPWGTPYQMVFDTDFNNVCVIENSVYGRLSGRGYAIWSFGPDRRGDTGDDLLSWKSP